MMTVERYVPGTPPNGAARAIADMMRGFDTGKSYADMMRYRICGAAADECNDTYYVAYREQKALSRLWMGWGKHPDAIGNWGNFYTDPAARGQGYGGALLRLWYEDFTHAAELPLCFLCTTGSRDITALYARFGFRPAIEGREYGPLYLPVGQSPSSFHEFCNSYYRPSDTLLLRPATVGYRHEIDCLLRFACIAMGHPFGLAGASCAEEGLLYAPDRTDFLFTPDGHCVGWRFDGQLQLHPQYRSSRIIAEQ
jgi:GNAT superfamily N-acetyltransferase